MKKTIYIAGKVTGLKHEMVLLKFRRAERMLQARGFQVVNPITVVGNPKEEWTAAMRKCLAALEKCDAIYMLPCAVDSPGAKLELQRAIEHNIEIYW